jgi:hypothetical protein
MAYHNRLNLSLLALSMPVIARPGSNLPEGKDVYKNANVKFVAR